MPISGQGVLCERGAPIPARRRLQLSQPHKSGGGASGPLNARGPERDPRWGATPGTVLLRSPEARIGVTRSVIYQRGCSDRSRGDLDKSRAAPDCSALTVSKDDGGVAAGAHHKAERSARQRQSPEPVSVVGDPRGKRATAQRSRVMARATIKQVTL